MIFIDSNIPMYLVGASHPHKEGSRRIVERLVSAEERLVTDAEVLQEILHRYVAIGRREAIGPAFEVLVQLVDEVFPVDRETVERARDVVLGHPRLSARDAIHVAVMQLQGIRDIVSFDAGFDTVPGLGRLAR